MAFVLEKPSRFTKETEEESQSLFEISQRGPSQAPFLRPLEQEKAEKIRTSLVEGTKERRRIISGGPIKRFLRELPFEKAVPTPVFTDKALGSEISLSELSKRSLEELQRGGFITIENIQPRTQAARSIVEAAAAPAIGLGGPVRREFLSETIKRAGRFLKNRIRFKDVIRNLDPDDIANAFAGRKSSLQAKKFVQELPAGERATVARNALKGEGAEFTETVSRFVKEVPQKAPAVPRGIEPGRPSLGELAISKPKTVKTQQFKFSQPREIKNLILKDRIVDEIATKSKLPEVPVGTTRIFRAESPTVKFEDVFDAKKLAEFGIDTAGREGNFYTDDLKFADFFRETFGRDAKIRFLDVPDEILGEFKIRPNEFVIDINELEKRIVEINLKVGVSDPDIIITKGTGLTPDDLPPLQEPRISAELNKRVIKAAEQMFTSGKLPRNPRIKISDNIKELLIEDKIPVPLLKEVLEANNLDLTQFAAGLFRLDTKFFAQQLNLLSQAQRKINNTVLSIDPKMRERIEELVGDTQLPDEFGRAKTSFIKRVENIRLGLMVSQLSTAVRNATTQAGRVGIDIFDQEIQAQLQRIFNVKPVKRISPLDGMEVVQDIVSFKKTAKAVDQILSVFPKQYDQLLGTFMSDIKIQMDKGLKPISVRDKILNKIDKAVAILNTVNRFQEFTIRRAVFLTRFDQNLRKAGISLEELLVDKAKFDETFLTNMRDKQFREFMMRSLEDSVGQALDVTFAQSPKAGTIARDLLEITKKIPFSSLVVPFPRFMMASIKFNFEFSPLGPLKLLSKAERAKIADGDMKVLSRAIIGTGMLGAAWLMRNSSHGGDETRFYEYKTDDGSIVDLRPFNPFVFYLFLAEVERRRQDGTLNSLTAKDFIIALAGVNVRAGTGLFLVDQLLEGITGISDERGLERAARLLKEFSGEALSGFAVPLQQIQDFYSEFDQNEAIIRERRLEPFKGPTKVKIPVISQTLEPRLSELKKGEIRRRNPAFKQVTGLIIKDKRNEIENAVINLGIPFRVFGIRTGDPGIDQQAKEVMAQLVENDVASIAKEFNRVLASKSHKKRPKLQRTQIRLGMTRALEIALGKARTEAINEVKKRPENIEFLRRKELEKIPKTLRRLISLSSRRRTLQEVAGQ